MSKGIPQSGYGRASFDMTGAVLLGIKQTGEEIELTFANRATITLKCEGDCCALAYFTDLEVASPLPATIADWENADGGRKDEGPYGDCRDTEFVKIKTDQGYINFTLHTDHNGYYGGWYWGEEAYAST